MFYFFVISNWYSVWEIIKKVNVIFFEKYKFDYVVFQYKEYKEIFQQCLVLDYEVVIVGRKGERRSDFGKRSSLNRFRVMGNCKVYGGVRYFVWLDCRG